MPNGYGEMSVTDEFLSKLQAYYNFIRGKSIPDNFAYEKPPLKLTKKQAFYIIYMLQEQMKLISDYIEICSVCETLYSTAIEGWHDEKTGKCYCTACDPYPN